MSYDDGEDAFSSVFSTENSRPLMSTTTPSVYQASNPISWPWWLSAITCLLAVAAFGLALGLGIPALTRRDSNDTDDAAAGGTVVYNGTNNTAGVAGHHGPPSGSPAPKPSVPPCQKDLCDTITGIEEQIDMVNDDVDALYQGIDNGSLLTTVDWQMAQHRDTCDPVAIAKDAALIWTAYSQNLSWVSLAASQCDWTMQRPMSAVDHEPLAIVTPTNLTPDELSDQLVGAYLCTMLCLEHTRLAWWLHNDQEEAGLNEVDSRSAFVYQTFLSTLGAANDVLEVVAGNGTLNVFLFGEPMALERLLSIRLTINALTSLNNFVTFPRHVNEQFTFTHVYSGSLHDYFGRFYNFYTANLGFMDWDYITWFTLLNYWPRGADFQPFVNPTFADRMQYLPEAMRVNGYTWKRAADDHEFGIGRYFEPLYKYDPDSAVVFLDDFDPEGLPRLPDQVPSFWSFSTAHLEPFAPPQPNATDHSVRAPFEELYLRFTDGFPLAWGNSTDFDFLFLTVPEVIEMFWKGTSYDQEKLYKNIAYVHNTYVRPEMIRFADAVMERAKPENQQNDHYPGMWRAKFQHVSRVHRDSLTDEAISFETPLDPSQPLGPMVNIPMNSSDNAAYASAQTGPLGVSVSDLIARFEQAQADMTEMETWMLHNLEVAVDSHVGDVYLVLVKNDTNKGIIGGNPYPSYQAILSNYIAEEAIVKEIGDPDDLPNLVQRSGIELGALFFDVKERLADELIKEQPARFNFSNPGDAGVYETNDNGTVVDVSAAERAAQEDSSFARCDTDVLGRHYGYDAAGNPIPSEQAVLASDTYEFVAVGNTVMDCIYRQHFAIDKDAPLSSGNIFDPVTNKTRYQYTDPGDSARRSQFVSEFSALETTNSQQVVQGQRGSYNRWVIDWVFQKIAKLVVDTAVENNLLSQAFVDEFYSTTLIDTNDPSTIPPASPEGLVFRVQAQLSGSASSGTSIDRINNFVNVTITFTTLTPVRTTSEMGTMLHEGALGHGFDGVPNAMNILREKTTDRAWTATALSQNWFDETEFFGIFPFVPGSGSLFEGWATLGEIIGVINNYYVLFNSSGFPIKNSQDTSAALNAIISLNRISARQLCSVAANFRRGAWTFTRLLTEFSNITGFNVQTSQQFVDRFYEHPMQQTSYANGFIVNVGLISFITNELEKVGKCFDLAKFIEFRILRTDYVAGGNLIEIAAQDIFQFEGPCPAKKRDLNEADTPRWSEGHPQGPQPSDEMLARLNTPSKRQCPIHTSPQQMFGRSPESARYL